MTAEGLGRFGELWIGHSWRGHELLVTILAYFFPMGSGLVPGIVLGGCAARTDQWRASEGFWAAALAESGLPRFDVREFVAETGPFAGWGEGQRNECLARLAGALPTGEGVAVLGTTFRARSEPQVTLAHAEPMLYDILVKQTAKRLGMPGQRVDFFFARNLNRETDIVNHARLVAEALAQTPEWRGRLGAVGEYDPEDPPLQAAALIAFAIYERLSTGQVRPALAALAQRWLVFDCGW